MRAVLSALVLCGLALPGAAIAQNAPQSNDQSAGRKLQPYIGCINRLSQRTNESRGRYLSWVDEKKGPTGKERHIYGLYTTYDPRDCAAGVAKAAGEAPAMPKLEAAGAEFAAAALEIEPLLNEANDYYDQGNYKDDKMAKGRALHPRLMAAFNRFAGADKALRAEVEELNDRVQAERLAAIERAEGRSLNYFVTDLMIKAKVLVRAENNEPKDFNVEKVTAAIAALEQVIKEIDTYNAANPDKKAGSFFVGNAKTFLTTAKELMRRVRDKTPYSTGEKMMLTTPGAEWTVSGSPPRLMRDYNQLVDAFNRGARF